MKKQKSRLYICVCVCIFYASYIQRQSRIIVLRSLFTKKRDYANMAGEKYHFVLSRSLYLSLPLSISLSPLTLARSLFSPSCGNNRIWEAATCVMALRFSCLTFFAVELQQRDDNLKSSFSSLSFFFPLFFSSIFHSQRTTPSSLQFINNLYNARHISATYTAANHNCAASQNGIFPR